MASEWQVTTLDQLGRIVTGKTPPSTVVDAFGGHIPFVTPSDMNGARIISTTARSLSAAGQATVKNAAIPKHAVMVSCIGSDMGKAAIAGTACATNQQINSIIVDAKNSPLFVYYNLSLRKAEIRGSASGSAQPILNKSAFGRLEIELPPLEEQRAIAETLGALDDRIDNLRQTNATLEAIAQALFKSWFVDFDGVPPEDMQESELRLIPKGWRVGRFDEAIDILGGGTPKTSIVEYWDGDIPWFSVVDAPTDGQVFVLDTEKKITALGLKNCSAKLLPEMTTIISARGTVGKVAMTGVPMAMNQSCYALRPKQQGGEAFVYFSTRRFVEQLQRIAHGAVFDTITRDSFKQVTTSLAPDKVIANFGETVNPLLLRIRANGQQVDTLASLRDTLLPRLISGQLRVKL